MRLYSPVDLTGYENMIEKLVSGTGTGDLPILSPTRWPLRHQVDRALWLGWQTMATKDCLSIRKPSDHMLLQMPSTLTDEGF